MTDALIELLRDDPVPGVVVLQSTRAGFELIDMLTGFDHAVIVDCLAVPDPVPGRVRELSLADFSGSARLNSAHEINIISALDLARQLGAPMPATIEIYAVEAADTITFTEILSPQVAAVVGPLARQLLSSLQAAASAPGKTTPHAASTPDTTNGLPTRRVFYPPDA